MGSEPSAHTHESRQPSPSPSTGNAPGGQTGSSAHPVGGPQVFVAALQTPLAQSASSTHSTHWSASGMHTPSGQCASS